MPYIDIESRERLKHTVEDMRDYIDGEPKTPGELNYLLTSMCDEYTKGQLSYSVINEVVGVLECVKLEYSRKVAVPYEIQKEHDNGGVLTCI